MRAFKIKGKYGIKQAIYIIYKYKIPRMFQYIFECLFCQVGVKNIIMLESHNDFDMNAGSLYQCILNNGLNTEFKIFWLVKNDTNKFKHDLPFNVFVLPLYGVSIKRSYINCSAKYLFYDDVPIKKTRDEQVCTYLGHATRAMKNCRGLVGQPTYIDYVISSSEENNALMAEVYECEPNKMRVTGMPVTDLLFGQWDELKKLKLDLLSEKKIVIWMPTFRKSRNDKFRNDEKHETATGLPLFESNEQYEQLNENLKSMGMHLLIKFHPSQDMKNITVKDTDNITLLTADRVHHAKIDTYKLLTQTDALISDYSSISFDYLLLDKPIAYVLNDFDDYKLGFAVENPFDFMSGDYLYSVDDFLFFLESVTNEQDLHKEERNQLKDKIHFYQDGKSSERVLKLVGLL